MKLLASKLATVLRNDLCCAQEEKDFFQFRPQRGNYSPFKKCFKTIELDFAEEC